MKFLNNLFNWLFNIKKNETFANVDNTTEEISKEQYSEYEEWLRLEDEKQNAIKQCKGCRDEVYVLSKNGEDIGYYSSLYKLSIANNFSMSNVYRAYKRDGIYRVKKSNSNKYNISKLI